MKVKEEGRKVSRNLQWKHRRNEAKWEVRDIENMRGTQSIIAVFKEGGRWIVTLECRQSLEAMDDAQSTASKETLALQPQGT